MFEKEIDKGVALLDEHRPQWYLHVDLDALDLDHCGQCVMGQTFGYFADGIYRLIQVTDPGADFWGFAEDHGFSVDTDGHDAEEEYGVVHDMYQTLTKEWVNRIIHIRNTRKHDR